MARSVVWKHNNYHNCMVKTEYPLSPHVPLRSSTAAVKPMTVKIKSEALTTASLEHTYDTRCREKKSERGIAITSTPLELPNHARALTLLTNVPSLSKPPQQKVEMRRTLRMLLQLWPFVKVFQHEMYLSQDESIMQHMPIQLLQ